jgi:hypothetical protein
LDKLARRHRINAKGLLCEVSASLQLSGCVDVARSMTGVVCSQFEPFLLNPQIAPPAAAELALRSLWRRNAMNNDKETSAIDKFKVTVSDAVGNLASIVTPSAERPKKVAATTSEQVYIPEAADVAAMPAARRKRRSSPSRKQKPNHQPDGKPQRRNDPERKNRSANKRCVLPQEIGGKIVALRSCSMLPF